MTEGGGNESWIEALLISRHTVTWGQQLSARSNKARRVKRAIECLVAQVVTKHVVITASNTNKTAVDYTTTPTRGL